MSRRAHPVLPAACRYPGNEAERVASIVRQTTSRRLGMLCAITLVVALLISVAALIGIRQLGGQIYAGDDLIGLELAQRSALLALVDEETGVRTYVATGDERFLDIYRNGHRQFTEEHRTVNAGFLHTGIAPDVAALNTTGALQLQRYFSDEIARVAAGHRSQATEQLTLGKILLDRYRRLDADLQERVLNSALDRTRATKRALRLAEEIALATIGLLGLLGASFVPLVRSGAGFERDALRDSVTTLGNRRAFLDRLLQRSREQKPFAVVLIDLDGFKAINDTLGHATGDRVLHLTGERLRAQLRPDDFAARLGGDEFAVLLDGVDSPEAALRISSRLCGEIERPSTGENGAVARVGASAGVCLYPVDARDGPAILAAADRAMYANKRGRRRSSGSVAVADQRHSAPVSP